MSDNRVRGRTFCITGTIDGGTRKQWYDAIARAYGYTRMTVTWHVNYVVVGAKPGKEKLLDAKQNGITTITVEQFLDMLPKEYWPENAEAAIEKGKEVLDKSRVALGDELAWLKTAVV